jgi:hypothetical protein
MKLDASVFYHPVSANALQALMRGERLKPIPTLCPTSDLIVDGFLVHYSLYERPSIFPLAVKDFLEWDTPNSASDPENMQHLKLNFLEGDKNSFTLQLLTNEERITLLKEEKLPKGASIVFSIPEAWKEKRDKSLTGGNIVLATVDLVTLFQGNLMQVINPKSPHNAQLYPDAKSKLEPIVNIYAYALVYLERHQKRLNCILKDPHHTALSLMDAKTLKGFKKEQALVLTLETITKLLGGLVDSYKQNQVPRELEEQIVKEVSGLPTDRLNDSYLKKLQRREMGKLKVEPTPQPVYIPQNPSPPNNNDPSNELDKLDKEIKRIGKQAEQVIKNINPCIIN